MLVCRAVHGLIVLHNNDDESQVLVGDGGLRGVNLAVAKCSAHLIGSYL